MTNTEAAKLKAGEFVLLQDGVRWRRCQVALVEKKTHFTIVTVKYSDGGTPVEVQALPRRLRREP